MDNGNTQKELVVRTYAGVDGSSPLAVYLGSLGYCLEFALRPGVQHSVCESAYNLESALPLVASLVKGPLLLRVDAGFCISQTDAGDLGPEQGSWTRDGLYLQSPLAELLRALEPQMEAILENLLEGTRFDPEPGLGIDRSLTEFDNEEKARQWLIQTINQFIKDLRLRVARLISEKS